MNLAALSSQLNDLSTDNGHSFLAQHDAGSDVVMVTCSNDGDAIITLVATDEQLLAVTPLVPSNTVVASKRAEFNEFLLKLSPILPLSSIGIEGDYYVLFGAMSVNTTLVNIAHELETQAQNYADVLAQFIDFIVMEDV